MKSYEEICEYLDETSQYAPYTGVKRGNIMLDMLGHEEKKIKIIHVAGTNGKGSVCAYLEQILRDQGFSTGLFTSPHLVDIRERIRINGDMISKNEFRDMFNEVEIQAGKAGMKDKLAYFDYFFLIAVKEFAKLKLDYCIFETGLGGRLDITNSISSPILTMITTISLEHTAILGDTVKKIATEKAGIIKDNVTLVCNADTKEALEVFREKTVEKHSPIVEVGKSMALNIKNRGNRIDFSLVNEYYKYDCFSIKTGADYQVVNCAQALTGAAVLAKECRFGLDKEILRQSVWNMYWPGRMEQIEEDIYVDGAHNPEGIESMLISVPEIAADRKRVLLFSVVSDKNYQLMVKEICDSGVFDEIILTVTGGKRHLQSGRLVNCFETMGYKNIAMFENTTEAFLYASRIKKSQNGVLFCTGSLYLAGDIKKMIAQKCVRNRG